MLRKLDFANKGCLLFLHIHRGALWHIGAFGQHLDARLRDEEGLFKLGTALAIHRGAGPVVGPAYLAPGALIDHWLNSEHMPRLHRAHCLVVGVVRDGRGRVEQLTNAMAAIRANDGAFS